MSFYFVLALFPFLLVLAAIVGWLPSTDLWQAFAQWIVDYLPRQSRHMVFSTVLDLTRGYTSFLSFGLAAMIWSASSGFVSLMESLSIAYGRKDTRSFWKQRALAVCATVVAAIFFLLSFALLAIGHWTAAALTIPLRSVIPFRVHWALARWLGTFLLLCLGIDLIDYFLPDVRRPWRWLRPSTVLVALLLTGLTLGFNFYVRHSSTFPRVYGALAGFIILMMWVYLASLILLIGAEANRVADESRNDGASA